MAWALHSIFKASNNRLNLSRITPTSSNSSTFMETHLIILRPLWQATEISLYRHNWLSNFICIPILLCPETKRMSIHRFLGIGCGDLWGRGWSGGESRHHSASHKLTLILLDKALKRETKLSKHFQQPSQMLPGNNKHGSMSCSQVHSLLLPTGFKWLCLQLADFKMRWSLVPYCLYSHFTEPLPSPPAFVWAVQLCSQ